MNKLKSTQTPKKATTKRTVSSGLLSAISILLVIVVFLLLQKEMALTKKIENMEQKNFIITQKNEALESRPTGDSCPDPTIWRYDLSSMKGFFVKANRIDWGEIPVTCEAFIVTEARPDLLSGYLNAANQGNSLTTKDDQGRPIINIATGDIDNATELQKLKQSSVDRPVELLVARKYEFGHGAPVCEKAVEILRVK